MNNHLMIFGVWKEHKGKRGQIVRRYWTLRRHPVLKRMAKLCALTVGLCREVGGIHSLTLDFLYADAWGRCHSQRFATKIALEATDANWVVWDVALAHGNEHHLTLWLEFAGDSLEP